MQVSDPNNVKIYNLSVGKSLPEWLSERKRRALIKKNADIRKRIQLIQDFEMPGVSTTVRVSPDGQYILATGIYKPRIKCFDVNNMSLKFERCFDAEAISFEILSEDYRKIVMLQNDRFLEFHTGHGRHYRLRIPKFGRDLKYHYPSCDLLIVGVAPDIYRLNLERGQFLTPFTSSASELTKCAINSAHHLIVCGTKEGRVEAWDHRSKTLVGTLDCAFSCINDNKQLEGFPSVSALKFDDALQLGVGTATGQILLYDIRSNKPYYIKDHMYGLPVKDIDFHYSQDLVFSMDSQILKIWNKNDGKIFTSIESTSKFNNLCVVPNSGLFFMANESPKIQTYFIPTLGPAPKWASYLDSLTEELEETTIETVYDDYKFVTKTELDNLGLEHLIGTNMLRAYMHGYFLDIRLYKKAKSVAEPFEFEEYRKKKVREIIEKDRENRIQIQKLPNVNKELASKLMNDELDEKKKKKKKTANLLEDDRFQAMFENPDFEIDKTTDEYRLLNPVLSKLENSKHKQLQKKLAQRQQEEEEKASDNELEGKNSSEESSSDFDSEDSSDDEHTWAKDVKKQFGIIQKEHSNKRRAEREQMDDKEAPQPKLFELDQGEEYKGIQSLRKKTNKMALGERLKNEDSDVKLVGSIGNREMSFSTNKRKSYKHIEEKNKIHREERKKLVRTTVGIKFKKNRFSAHRGRKRR